MISRALLFICSFLAFINSYGQVRINQIALGIDPLRSLTMLAPEKNPYNNRYYYNSWQANAEVIFPMRTSFVVSYGYTKAHLQELQNTLDYYSHGNYFKFGLNFYLSKNTSRMQGVMGWRIGSSNYTENAFINLKGDYWGSRIDSSLGIQTKNALWGEFLLEERIRVSTNKSSLLYNIWFSTFLSLRLNNRPSTGNYTSYNIPGFGRYDVFSPAITFNLAYYFNFKHKTIYPDKFKQRNYNHKRRYGTILDYE